jgi:AcrR family transcriptional regulator
MGMSAEAIDGRAARAQRTRRAVVDALLDLIEEGDPRPTAPRIAERAGVSLRSIFQHFSDLEALFSAAAERQMERTLRLIRQISADGPFRDRLEAFVTQRTRILEAITPVRRAALLQEPFSAELRASRDRFLGMAQTEVERVFNAEISRFPKAMRRDVLDAATAASGWQLWESLRAHQGLSVSAARRVMTRMVSSVLSPAPPA